MDFFTELLVPNQLKLFYKFSDTADSFSLVKLFAYVNSLGLQSFDLVLDTCFSKKMTVLLVCNRYDV